MARGSKRRSRMAYVGTLVSMALLLLLLMLGGYLNLFMNDIEKTVKEQVELDVYFYDSSSEADIKRIQKEVVAEPYVKQAVYVSKDSALATISRGIEVDQGDLLDVNPLPASINVLLNEQNFSVDSVKKFEDWLMDSNAELIEEVYYDKNQFASINSSFQNISFYITLFSTLLLFVAVALIFITVRLSIYAQRFTIKTMQMVGAKSSFIKRPFLFNAILLGLGAGLLAIVLFIGLGYMLSEWKPELLFNSGGVETINLTQGSDTNDFQIFAILFGAIILGGVLISYLSTSFALRKYIRIKTDNLY